MRYKNGFMGNNTGVGKNPYYRFNGWIIKNVEGTLGEMIQIIKDSDMSEFKRTKVIYPILHNYQVVGITQN